MSYEMTNIQSVCVLNRVKNGYTLLGEVCSTSTDTKAILIIKGIHTMAINCLGYDEHINGRTYNVTEVML